MKICVIFNPTARGQKASKFRDHLRDLASECSLKPTHIAGAGRSLASEAVREGFDTIVAAGGDGTVNEVVNGIAEEEQGLAGCRLAVLPLGTVNVFAKEIGMPTRFTDAWKVIRAGHETRIDLPVAEFQSDGLARRRYFAQMAGAGLDARAVDLVNWEHKKRLGQLAYGIAGLKALRETKTQIVATANGETIGGELVLIGNGRFYAGPYPFFPLAEMQDGLLEVSIFPRVNWLSLGRGALGLVTNRLYTVGGVRNFRAPSVEVSSAGRAMFHLEGENAGHLPVKFSIQGAALRVVVPDRPAR